MGIREICNGISTVNNYSDAAANRNDFKNLDDTLSKAKTDKLFSASDEDRASRKRQSIRRMLYRMFSSSISEEKRNLAWEEFKHRGSSIVPILIELLENKDTDPEAKEWVMAALGCAARMEKEEIYTYKEVNMAFDALAKALDDDDLMMTASWYLGHLYEHLNETISYWRSLELEGEAQEEAKKSADELSKTLEKIIPLLLDKWQKTKSRDKYCLLHGLKFTRSPKAIPCFIEALGPYTAGRDTAEEGLIELAALAVPDLIRFIENNITDNNEACEIFMVERAICVLEIIALKNKENKEILEKITAVLDKASACKTKRICEAASKASKNINEKK